ncbi:MAG: tetratricopeptide repeat protein [candidate division Zixibacteria bacterium]|nr:tetratricopeptide repeat protein [candidate division Zixibacteria bacterium]
MKKKIRKSKLTVKNVDFSKIPQKDLSTIDSLEKLIESGKYVGVLSQAKKAISNRLTNKVLKERAVYLGAFALARLNKFKEAQDFIDNNIFIPDNLDRAYLKCFLYLKLNQSENVISCAAKYMQMLRFNPKAGDGIINRSCENFRYDVHNNAGLSYKNTNQLFKAIREFELAVKLNPNHRQSIINLVYLLHEQHRYNEARSYTENALKHFKDDPHFKSIYGIILYEMGQKERGKKLIDEIVSKYPDNPDALSNLGVMFEKEGELVKARELYNKALSFDPQHRSTRMNLFQLEVKHFDRKPTISLCMIVKDEEENLPRCLESVKDVVDQIVVVDTGSSDKTPEIAKQYGAEVYFHPWKNSFSEARNNSIKYATGDWIIYLDADEELFNEDKELLRSTAFNTKCTIAILQIFNPLQGELEGYLQYTRMWRNFLGFRFEGIVHNQLICDGPAVASNVRIRHYGYGFESEKMNKKYERSKKLLEKQIDENPDNAFALFNLAQIHRSKKEHDAAIENALKTVSLLSPDDKSSLHIYLMALDQLSSTYFFMGEFDKSIEYGLKAINRKKDYFDPMMSVASAYMAKKDNENALKYYFLYLDTIENFDPKQEKLHIIFNSLKSHHYAYYGIGLAMMNLEKYGEAEHYFRKVIERIDNHLRIYYQLGVLAYNRDERVEAKELFNKDIIYNGELADTCEMLGLVANDDGEYEKAVGYLRKTIAVEPENWSAHLTLAKSLVELSDFQNAKEHLDIVIHYRPTSHDVYRVRGNVKFTLGQFDEAVADYQEYLKFEAGDYKTLGNLGNSYFRLKQYEDAVDCYSKAISLNPAYDVNYLNMGVCLKEIGEFDQAAIRFKEYHSQNTQNIGIFIAIADCLTAGGHYEEALEYYEKYLLSDPTDYLAIFKLAECYRFSGAHSSALMGYKAVLRVNPDFKPALEMVQKVEGEPQNILN